MYWREWGQESKGKSNLRNILEKNYGHDHWPWSRWKHKKKTNFFQMVDCPKTHKPGLKEAVTIRDLR